jgi:putative two-component system response regulator
MDGYEVCRRIKSEASTRDVPIMFVTAKTEDTDQTYGFELGAVDYVTKPFSPEVLRQRVRTHVELKRARDALLSENERLERKVLERTRLMSDLQDTAMAAMGSLAESRDPETGNHIRRTQHYVRALAEYLKDDARYGEKLTPEYITMLFKSAPLHDVGKVGIRDDILLKPDALAEEEFEIMKTHAEIGREAIERASEKLAEGNNFLRLAAEIAGTHHEKWDGTGYPHGLAGEEIPLSGRLMALADVYDALISRRCYKPPFPHSKARGIIVEGRGKHFDPAIVDAFVAIETEFIEIAKRFADEAAPD